MANNIFTGLGDLFQPIGTGDQNTKQQMKVFPGHVLDICLEEDSSLFKTAKDIGAVRFRDIINEYDKPEKECVKIAYPLDRSIARYPNIGEEVMIFRAFGDMSGTESNTRTIGNIYYYSFVVSTMHNITYNSHPFLGSTLKTIDPANESYDKAKVRFEKKAKDLDLVKQTNNTIKVYKQLQPYEGDFILQGRFGNSIRFGATSAKIDTPWATKANGVGTSGDGVMILRVDRDFATNEKDMITKENVDTDDSSIYLCSTQKIEMSLACSTELKSWRARYNLDQGKATKQAYSEKDTSKLWQKPIGTSQPASQTYQSPKV